MGSAPNPVVPIAGVPKVVLGVPGATGGTTAVPGAYPGVRNGSGCGSGRTIGPDDTSFDGSVALGGTADAVGAGVGAGPSGSVPYAAGGTVAYAPDGTDAVEDGGSGTGVVSFGPPTPGAGPGTLVGVALDGPEPVVPIGAGDANVGALPIVCAAAGAASAPPSSATTEPAMRVMESPPLVSTVDPRAPFATRNARLTGRSRSRETSPVDCAAGPSVNLGRAAAAAN